MDEQVFVADRHPVITSVINVVVAIRKSRKPRHGRRPGRLDPTITLKFCYEAATSVAGFMAKRPFRRCAT